MKAKKPTTLAQVVASQKHLLKAIRHQTDELGHLRKLVLEMRRPGDYDWYRGYRDGLMRQ